MRCLILMIENNEKISSQFLGSLQSVFNFIFKIFKNSCIYFNLSKLFIVYHWIDYLKNNDFLNFTLSTIESEETILFEKIDHREKSQHDVDLTGGRVESNVYLVDMFIHFLISLNKKFILPKDNLVLNEILLKKDASHKTLSEYLIKILNLESKFKRF